MTKTVVLENTLNYMLSVGKHEEAQNLISSGEHKIIVEGNVRYLLFKDEEK